jgi:histidinol-phosphatase
VSTPKYSLAEDLALALKIADTADLITQSRYQSQDLVITTKPDNTPVTDADKATETAIREILMKERPNDGLLGEEFGESENLGSRYWVIDPIDGTKNFMRAVPTWSTLIALIEDGEVIVGVVSAPAVTRRWHASKGHNAYVAFNRGAPRKISVSKVSQIKDASLTYSDFVGFGERRDAFIALIDVAEGSADIAVEPILALWDMAALDIIVREAGGSFTSISGEPGPHHGSGLSTNGLLLDQAVKHLNGTTH